MQRAASFFFRCARTWWKLAAPMATTASQPAASGKNASGDLAARLREFGPLGTLAFLFILAGSLLGPLVAAPLVLLWVALSRAPWRDVGYVPIKNRAMTIPLAILGGVTLKLLLKA